MLIIYYIHANIIIYAYLIYTDAHRPSHILPIMTHTYIRAVCSANCIRPRHSCRCGRSWNIKETICLSSEQRTIRGNCQSHLWQAYFKCCSTLFILPRAVFVCLRGRVNTQVNKHCMVTVSTLLQLSIHPVQQVQIYDEHNRSLITSWVST